MEHEMNISIGFIDVFASFRQATKLSHKTNAGDFPTEHSCGSVRGQFILFSVHFIVDFPYDSPLLGICPYTPLP